jgi:hypothetical protein
MPIISFSYTILLYSKESYNKFMTAKIMLRINNTLFLQFSYEAYNNLKNRGFFREITISVIEDSNNFAVEVASGS